MSTANPYSDHPRLSPLEAEVLGEYAKLADTIKKITELARDTAEHPNGPLLDDLRELEKKMKLVFTSYQTSVYRITQDYLEAEEAAYDAEANETVQTVQYEYDYDQTVEGDSTVRY